MGRDKAQLPFEGGTLGEFLGERLAAAFEETILCDGASDAIPGIGPLAGLESGLGAARHDWVFLLACDMPHFSLELVRLLWNEAQQESAGAVIPMGPTGREPLHALVHRRALLSIRRAIAAGRYGIEQALEDAGIRYFPWERVREISPDGSCFENWNRPEDLPAALRTSVSEAAR